MAKRNSRNTDKMPASLAVDLADSMDLPDGAYFAMIGDMLDGDYMDGVDAFISENDLHE